MSDTLWEVGEAPFVAGFVELKESGEGYELTVCDGAEAAGYKLTTEQLLNLAYIIYEELG